MVPAQRLGSQWYATDAGNKTWEYLKTEKRDNGVAVVRLHRPDALNALCGPLMGELVSALKTMDADADVKAVVLTGSDRAFAAGADIKEMKDKNYAEVRSENLPPNTHTTSLSLSRDRFAWAADSATRSTFSPAPLLSIYVSLRCTRSRCSRPGTRSRRSGSLSWPG